jgi:hypothetical protein
MPVPARDQRTAKPSGPAPTPAAAGPRQAPSLARARALQRSAGNRAAGRVLARWIKHPDPEQKGVMVPDSAAEDFERFNPPKNE